jgi:hypothetical protein
VDGGATLERCLTALAAQTDPPPLEILVPHDDSVSGIAPLAARFPSVRFLPLGHLPTRYPAASPGGQHELFDRRRSGGLLAATGDLVAILEDRGAPSADWARTAVRLHAAMPHAVIGGAVDNSRDRTLNWAVFFCDFGRYQPPLEAGPRDYVTDVNVCYKRRALEATRALWSERYHETTVHWQIQRSGETLYLTPELVVSQAREGLRLGALLRERVSWGRLFAYTRARERSAGARLALAVLAPALPFLLIARQLRLQLGKRTLGRWVVAAPAAFLLLAAWSAGELAGYVTGEP